MTPDERWANQNSVSQRATPHQPEASDPTQMKSAPVYKGQSIHPSHPTQPPIPATNRNSVFPFGLECCEFPGLYKPALPDLRQDLTAEPYRVNNSGSSLSSPSLLHPCTKPFSGRPARPQITCPTREAGGSFEREAWDRLPAVAARPTPRHQRRHRSRSARSCGNRTPSPAAHCCGYWDHQPAATSAINEETRFQKAITQAPSQSLYGNVPATQALASPRTLV